MGFASSNGNGSGGFAATSSNLSPLAPPFTVDRPTPSRSALDINAAPFATPYTNWGNSQALDYNSTPVSETITSSLFPNSTVYSYSVPPAEPQIDHVVYSSSSLTNANLFTQFPSSLMTNDFGDENFYAPSSTWDSMAQNELGYRKSSMSLNSVGTTQDNYTQSLYGLQYPTQWDLSCEGRLDIESGGKKSFLDRIGPEVPNSTNASAYTNYFKEGTELPKVLSKSSGESWVPQINSISSLQENPVISLGTNGVVHKPFSEFNAKETYASKFYSIPPGTSGISMATTPDISVMDSWGHLMPPSATNVTVQKQHFADQSPLHLTSFQKVTTRPPSVVTSSTTSGLLPLQNILLNDMTGTSDNIVRDHLYNIRDPWVCQRSNQGQETKKYVDISYSSIEPQRYDSNVSLFPTAYGEQSGIKNVTTSGALDAFKHEVADMHDNIHNLEGFSLLINESDQYNPSEDSPCWKGSNSHFSHFQVSEAIPSQHHLKTKNSYDGLNLNEPQTSCLSCKIPKTVLSTDFHEKTLHSTNGCHGEADTLISSTERGYNGSHLYDEPKSEVSHTANKFGATERNSGNGFCFSKDNHRAAEPDAVDMDPFRVNKPEPSNPIRLCLETMCCVSDKEKATACMMNTDVKLKETLEEWQSYVPSNAAKQVLSSLSSDADISSKHKQENWDEYATESKSMLIKTIVNLSDSLLFYYLNDENPVGNDDHKTLELVLSKLTMCLKFTQEKAVTKECSTRKQAPSNVSSEVQACHSLFANLHDASHEEKIPVSQQEKANDSLGTKAKYQKDGAMLGSNFERLLEPVTADGTEEAGSMTKAIKEILDANFHEDAESHPVATIYKNLWLEAEALLCSTSYKARYFRMKNEMEKSGSHEEKDKSLDCKVSPTHVEGFQESLSVDKSVHAPDIMERYNVLRTRGETYGKSIGGELEFDSSNISSDQRTADKLSNQVDGHTSSDTFIKDASTGCLSHDRPGTNICRNLTTSFTSTYPADITEDHVMSRLQVLKSRGDYSSDTEPEQQASELTVDCVGKRDCSLLGGVEGRLKPIFETGLTKAMLDHTEDGLNGVECASGSKADFQKFAHTSQMFELGAQFSGGWYENTSSDWEHVLKDEFTWTGEAVNR